MKIDHIILICNGCKQERTFYPDAPIASVEEFDVWLKTQVTQCTNVLCTAKTCDVKAHLMPEPGDK